MSAHADPRLVIAVLERAAEMLEGGAIAAGILSRAMENLGYPDAFASADGYSIISLVRDAETSIPMAWSAPDEAEESRLRTVKTRTAAARLRGHLASVALFCGALAGALDTIRPGPDGSPVVDTIARELIAQHIAGDPLAIVALRDLVEERGLTTEHGAWTPVALRQRWIETGPHEHAWHDAVGENIGGRRGTMTVGVGGPIVRQCTCGLYEHEEIRYGADVQVRLDGARRVVSGDRQAPRTLTAAARQRLGERAARAVREALARAAEEDP